MRMLLLARGASYALVSLLLLPHTTSLHAEGQHDVASAPGKAAEAPAEPAAGHPLAQAQPAEPSFEQFQKLIAVLIDENRKNLVEHGRVQREFEALNAAGKASPDLSNPVLVGREGIRLNIERSHLLDPWLNDPLFRHKLETDPQFRALTYGQVSLGVAQGEVGRWLVAYQDRLNAIDREGKKLSSEDRARLAARTLRQSYPKDHVPVFENKALVAQELPLRANDERYRALFPKLAPGEKDTDATIHERQDYLQQQVTNTATVDPQGLAVWETEFKLQRDPEGFPKKVTNAYASYLNKRAKALPKLNVIVGRYLSLKQAGALAPSDLHNAFLAQFQDVLHDAPKRLALVEQRRKAAVAAVERVQKNNTPENWQMARYLKNQWAQSVRDLADEQDNLDNVTQLGAVAELANLAAERRAGKGYQQWLRIQQALLALRKEAQAEKDPAVRERILAAIKKQEEPAVAKLRIPRTCARDAFNEALAEVPKHLTPAERTGAVVNDPELGPETSAGTAGSQDFNPESIAKRLRTLREGTDSFLSPESTLQMRRELILVWENRARRVSPERFEAIQKVFGAEAQPKRLRGTPPLDANP